MYEAEGKTDPPEAAVENCLKSYRYLDAVKIAPQSDFLISEKSTLTAIRLLSKIGNNRYSNFLIHKAVRRFPENQLFRLYYFSLKIPYTGFFQSYLNLSDIKINESSDTFTHMYYKALSAYLALNLNYLSECESILNDPIFSSSEKFDWHRNIRLELLHKRDNRKEVMNYVEECIDDFLSAESCSPFLFSCAVDMMWKYGYQKRAVDILEEADKKNIQLYNFYIMLGMFHLELEGNASRMECCLEVLKKDYAEYFDRDNLNNIKLIEYEIARHRSDREKILEIIPDIKGEKFRKIEKRLKNSAELSEKSIKLDVPLVGQKDMTCVPATLASIAAYFGIDLDHDELAEKICLNGTATNRLFSWAEASGWTYRVFTFNIEDCRKLLEAGLPFALFTEQINNKHCQAVTGLDFITGEVLIREPGMPLLKRVFIDDLLENQKICGPVCAVFVPDSHRKTLLSMKLKDESGYKLMIEIESALERHDIKSAEKSAADLPETHPAYFETMLRLYSYKMAGGLMFELAGKFYLRNKDNELALWKYIICMSTEEHGTEKLKLLEEVCDRTEAPHPMFYQAYADVLSLDERNIPDAEKTARRAVRRNPGSGICCNVLGRILSAVPGRESEAFEAYKAAAFLEYYNEVFWEMWFDFSMRTGREEEVLNHMRQRTDRLGGKTSVPGVTLASSLLKLNRVKEAFSVLEEQIRRFDKGCHAAAAYARMYTYISNDEAKKLINALKGKISDTEFRMTYGAILYSCGEWREALKLFRNEAESSPDNSEAFSRYVEIEVRYNYSDELFERLYRDAATSGKVGHLEAVAAAAKEHRPDIFVKASEDIIKIDHLNMKAIRDLGFYYLKNKDLKKAGEYCRRAAEISSHSAQTQCLLGTMLFSPVTGRKHLNHILRH
jgi:tetratricopeptide (TPR) repeat protein